jgi:hypothetical protein
MIGVPSSGQVKAGFAYSLAGLIGRIAAGFPTIRDRGVQVALSIAQSSVVHANREKLIQEAIDQNKTHLLFIDDDMVFQPNTLEIMLARRQPVVTTTYPIKHWPVTEFTAVNLDKQRQGTTARDVGLQEIIYSGFGFSLFEVEALKNTTQPRCMPEWRDEPGFKGYTTEDLPLYEALRNAGYHVWLDHDASKLISHAGDFTYNWAQVNTVKEEYLVKHNAD